jgi:hypothetical protein
MPWTARLLSRLMPMTDAQWATFNFGSIMWALFRYPCHRLQPRDNAVAIVALLRTMTATNRADGLFSHVFIQRAYAVRPC